MWVFKETNGPMYWEMRDRSGTLFHDQAGLTTVRTSDTHTPDIMKDGMTVRWAVTAIR
jgi:hypothetical protein